MPTASPGAAISPHLAVRQAWLDQRREAIIEPDLADRRSASSSGRPARDRPLPDKPSIAVLPFVNMSGDTGRRSIGCWIWATAPRSSRSTKPCERSARSSSSAYKIKREEGVGF